MNRKTAWLRCLHTEGKDDDKSDIWLFVGYCQSQSAAMNELYSRRFQKTPDRPEQWSWDDEIATVVVNPFKLGDYSLGRPGGIGRFWRNYSVEQRVVPLFRER